MPHLRSLIVGDPPSAWLAAGFEVRHHHGRARTTIGEVDIELVGPDDGRGIIAWRFADESMPTDIDGIRTLRATERPTDGGPSHDHENLVTGLDHVVMFTPDLDRTVAAMQHAGFDARRTRDVPGSDPPTRQVFFWAGPTIVELVGPVEPSGDGPATLWGLAVTADDLDAVHSVLEDRLGRPKPAVQSGRSIATLRTRDLGISTAIAFMTPHESSAAPSP